MSTEEDMEIWVNNIIEPIYDPSPPFYEDETK